MAKKKGRYTPPFTLTQRAAVVRDYNKGKTLEELAENNNCSTAKVRKVLLAEKVKMRPRGPLNPKKVKAKKISKPKAKKVVKPKAKSKNASKALLPSKGKNASKSLQPTKAHPAPKVALEPKGKIRKELTPEQREAKNARDRARRAASKSGLTAALAQVGQPT